MRIKNIELHNFGSYGDHNSFNFESDTPEERIVVIGGKNGALPLSRYVSMVILHSVLRQPEKDTLTRSITLSTVMFALMKTSLRLSKSVSNRWIILTCLIM